MRLLELQSFASSNSSAARWLASSKPDVEIDEGFNYVQKEKAHSSTEMSQLRWALENPPSRANRGHLRVHNAV